jgi:proteasome lid subunit RPN8/RPN11
VSHESVSLRLGPDVRTAIEDHACDTYPFECCGALIGHRRGVVAAVPLENVTDEGPRRRFSIRPQDYLAVERHARDANLELLGFYHSHPDHPARPSAHDLANAWPNLHYVILSVVQGQVADLRSWQLRDDRSAFEEVAVAHEAQPKALSRPRS